MLGFVSVSCLATLHCTHWDVSDGQKNHLIQLIGELTRESTLAHSTPSLHQGPRTACYILGCPMVREESDRIFIGFKNVLHNVGAVSGISPARM